MNYFVWGLIVLLIVLHQDFWFWSDGTLLFGFLPIGIGYHVGISLAAAVVWFLATKYAWPDGLEAPDAHNQEGPADV
jgi:hypothetical protein